MSYGCKKRRGSGCSGRIQFVPMEGDPWGLRYDKETDRHLKVFIMWDLAS